MIDFQAPDGWDVISTELGNFKVVRGILSLEDGVAVTLAPVLDGLGFINLGVSSVVNLRVVSGQFTEAGASPWLLVPPGGLNISVWPVDPATPGASEYVLERSFDGGDTPLAIASFGGEFSTSVTETEVGVFYRLRNAKFAGGADHFRLSR